MFKKIFVVGLARFFSWWCLLGNASHQHYRKGGIKIASLSVVHELLVRIALLGGEFEELAVITHPLPLHNMFLSQGVFKLNSDASDVSSGSLVCSYVMGQGWLWLHVRNGLVFPWLLMLIAARKGFLLA
ncbi:hypothetical protein ACOSP7_008938 [Xanthoceras sorbifolium]